MLPCSGWQAVRKKRQMQRIRVLPERVVNRIAAGEVVDRPSSVVKELMENSIDAGSDHITVEIKGDGRESIKVIDDGIGMTEEDLLLAFERHATSKIAKTRDNAARFLFIISLVFSLEAS